MAGPGRSTGRVLKECRKSLVLFQITLDTHSRAWKSLLIVPVPKSSKPQILNDDCPVVLTSIVMKSLDRKVFDCVVSELQNKSDLLHSAYMRGRSTDAFLHVLHRIYCH